jgi:hypothetical protein
MSHIVVTNTAIPSLPTTFSATLGARTGGGDDNHTYGGGAGNGRPATGSTPGGKGRAGGTKKGTGGVGGGGAGKKGGGGRQSQGRAATYTMSDMWGDGFIRGLA